MANYGADGYFGNSPEQQAEQDAAHAAAEARRVTDAQAREQHGPEPGGDVARRGVAKDDGCMLLFLGALGGVAVTLDQLANILPV